MIFTEIKDDLEVIMKDVFGNYVVQKVLTLPKYNQGEHNPKDLLEQIKGKLFELSKHAYGWRVVQVFLDVLSEDGQKDVINELEEDVMGCI